MNKKTIIIGIVGLASLAFLGKKAAEYIPFADLFKTSTSRYRLPSSLLQEVARAESGFDPEAYNEDSGAAGLMQFMPKTAAGFGIDPYNPVQAIDAGARYLRENFDRFGSWPLALVAYNWGPTNLATKGVAKAPSETRQYTLKISKAAGLGPVNFWG